jgi:uncharacterized protein with GYD domain
MLTRLSPEAVRSPKSYKALERRTMSAVREECPQVKWRESFAILGPYDYLDLFDAPDIETAMKVAALIRIGGQAQTEVWAATAWPKFERMVQTLPEIESLVTVAG